VPVIAANTPKIEYTIPIPITYDRDIKKELVLEVCTDFEPTYEATTGISGYTQGVKLASTPPKKQKNAETKMDFPINEFNVLTIVSILICIDFPSLQLICLYPYLLKTLTPV